MVETAVVLHFSDACGRRHLAKAIAQSRGWTLVASVDGRTYVRECDRWQNVERTLEWLARHAADTQAVAASNERDLATA